MLSLLASPTANALFHNCVPMSFMAYQALTLDESATIASSFAAALDVSGPTCAAFADKTFEEILTATVAPSEHCTHFVNIAPGWMDIGGAMLGKAAPAYPGKMSTHENTRMMHREGGGGGFSFMPTTDGELLMAAQQLCIREGVASHVKVLFGSDRDEMAFRADRKNPKASMMATYGHITSDRQTVLHQVRHEVMGFGDPDTTPPMGDDLLAIADEITDAYAEEYGDDGDWQTPMDRFCSDAAFGASTLMCAAEQAAHNPDQTWAYRWDGFADNYAFHGWELMFLFNTPPPGLLERAPEVQVIADAFRAAFVALCKHGDPNCAEVPRWEPFEVTQKELMVFGDEIRVCATAEEHTAIHV